MKTSLTLLAAVLGLAAAPARAEPPEAPRGPVLFEDDMEDGLSPAWREVADGVRVVPEDPDRPDGNRVARLDAPGRFLAAGPALLDRVDSTPEEQAERDRWDDYAFRFRFRLGRAVGTPEQPFFYLDYTRHALWAVSRSLLVASWRIDPHPGNPREAQDVHVMAMQRSSGTSWLLEGPRVHWYGDTYRDQFGSVRWVEFIDRRRKVVGAVDAAWHEVVVRVEGERLRLWFDGEWVFEGRDDRVTRGAVALRATWEPEADPGWIDIDDVSVRRLEPDPPEAPGTDTHQQDLKG